MSARNPDNDSEFDGESRLESGYASLDGDGHVISKAEGTANGWKCLVLEGERGAFTISSQGRLTCM